MRLIRFLFLALLSAPWAATAGAADVDALVGEVLRTVEATRALEGRFVQTARMAATGFDQVAGGRVWFAKGGRMRWEYEGDDPQVLVSDGETLWIHQVRDRTVLRQRLTDLPPTGRLALDLLNGLGRARDHFHIEACGDRCLVLRPKEPQPDLDRVEIRLLPDRGLPASVTTYDPLGNRTVVEFSGLREVADTPADLFRFQVPEGVQVVGAGEAGR
ncbi:LolA family protein [Deferrisoma sp.]